ncbi:MAG: hypothetical protein WBQ17_10335 [Rhizomicrobium sp.]
MKTAASTSDLTSTQRGAIGESIAAAGLMLASGGQLSPYRPVADDDGADLLLVDKLSRSIVQLQVKCRAKADDSKAETVQFDVRLNTFSENAKGYVLGLLLDGTVMRKAWLIPLAELRSVARTTPGKLVIVASAKDRSEDRFRRFRHENFESVVRIIVGDDLR